MASACLLSSLSKSHLNMFKISRLCSLSNVFHHHVHQLSFSNTYESCHRVRSALNVFSITITRHCHHETNSNNKSDEDGERIERIFLDERVQGILHKITGFDVNKIFEPKKMAPLRSPKYRFMTDNDLKMAIEQGEKQAKQRLQMPPVKVAAVDEEPEVMAYDPEIEHFQKHKFVFVDASHGYSDKERFIVVRETNGILRKANRDERHRMNQVFYPVEKREMEHPKMFEDEHLQKVLARGDYKFILDRACLQFEPDDPLYIQVVHTTYDHILLTKNFDDLRSTRHFGVMAYYYAYFGKLDGLMLDCIQRELIEDAADLVRLHLIIHPREDIDIDINQTQPLDLIKFYVRKEAIQKAMLELGVQKYEQIVSERQNKEANVAENEKQRNYS